MPANAPVAKTEGSNNGLDFVTVLRDCLNSGVIVLDDRRKITAFNPYAEQLTGLNAAAITGQNAASLPEPLESLVVDIFSSRQPSSNHQVLLRDAKGNEFAALVSAVPLGKKGKT